ncbi:MAG: 2-phospho-L-lactate/phosphoenolpyruvate guanylyltransferase [Frankiaceae bacterium]|jgi:2-phospho-L-lactate guanylyltransferase|nr:2-phospho-L-lactate/phosphoenolpyruvate guanylyltransferase [Frankiaceae bacterium]
MPDVQAETKPWAVVVPVKRLGQAKTRLGLPAAARARLALAMAEDTILACVAAGSVRRVVVVTDDPDGAAMAAAAGAAVVADEPDAGLNPALRHGAAHAAEVDPDIGIVTVSSDLPAVRAADVDAMLRAMASDRVAIVADAAGTGTVLYAAASIAAFDPAYGGESRAAHARAGATDRTAEADARLRRDVDTIADLVEAYELGVGAATRRAVEAIGGMGELSGLVG